MCNEIEKIEENPRFTVMLVLDANDDANDG